MKPGVEFLLLHNGDVLVRVTTTAGEEGHNHISHTASYRMNNAEFCKATLPIIYQFYKDNWPPPPAPNPKANTQKGLLSLRHIVDQQ